MRERLLKRISDLIYLRHRLILLLAVIVTGLAGYFYSRLELHLTFLDMLSEDEPAVKQYRYATHNFGSLSFLFVVLEAPEVEKAKAYADALAPRLLQRPEFVKRVHYKVDLDLFLDHGLLFLPEPALKELARMVEENPEVLKELHDRPGILSVVHGLDRVLERLLSRGQLPDTPEEFNLAEFLAPQKELVAYFKDYGLKGPSQARSSALRESLFSSFLGQGQKLPFDLSDAYQLSRDRRHLLFLVEPARPAENFEWCTEFMEFVEGEMAAVDQEIPGVWHGATGNAAVMRDDNRVIRRDMARTTLIAYLLIMALFAYSFRDLSSILIVGSCLGLGILWSLGAAYLIFGYLTPITAIFGAILLGMGIDYAILILSRYTEERHRGYTIKQALDITLTKAGKGILTGAAATSLAFFTITAGSFRGSQEMGIVAGTGILIFLAVMLLVQTSLLITWDGRRSLRGPAQARVNPRIMRLLARGVGRGAPVIFPVLALAVGGLAYVSPRYSLEYNYLNLEPAGVESIELINQIPEWFNIDTNFGLIVSGSMEEDREFSRALRDKPTVSLVDSISAYLPENQGQKLPYVRKLESLLEPYAEATPAPNATADPDAPEFSVRDYAELKSSLAEVREKIKGIKGLAFLSDLEDVEAGAGQVMDELDGLLAAWDQEDPAQVRRNLAGLDQQAARSVQSSLQGFARLSRSQGLTLTDLKRDYPELLDRFEGKDGRFLIYAYPSLVIWDEHNLKAVVADLKSVSAEAMGVGVLFNRILDQIKHDLFRIALYALIAVFVVISLDYRNPLYTLLTLIPLAAGGIAMVGTMNLLGIKFNVINIGMLPLIIGVGIDYGVYVVHRWIGEGKSKPAVKVTVESTGRAVALCALTTMIGFGAVATATWRGLAGMGRTMTMGIGFCLIAAVVLLPALLALISRKDAK